MNRRYAYLAAVAMLVGTAAFAASHIIDIAWAADGRFTHRTSVEPGKFVELCGKLEAGDAIRWSFDASAPMDFNIHYHVGDKTEYPTKQAQISANQGTLRIAVAEDYCWMWSNKSTHRLRVNVLLQR